MIGRAAGLIGGLGILITGLLGLAILFKALTDSPIISTELCDPAVDECLLVDYVEYYDYKEDKLAGVAAVHVGGVLMHSINGWNDPWYEQDYTFYGRHHVPTAMMTWSGCPEYQDMVEAMDIAREFQAAFDKADVNTDGRA